MKARTSHLLGLAALSVVLLATDCGRPLRDCTEADLHDFRYEDFVVGGDSGRIIFERAAYPTANCMVRWELIIQSLPAERTWVSVSVPDLTPAAIAPPLPGPVNDLVTDGHWAAWSKLDGSVMLRDLDTAEDRAILPPDQPDYRFVEAVARPYVLWTDSNGSTIHNVENGAEQHIASAVLAFALSSPFIAYSEFIDPDPSGDQTRRLKLLNLETGEETVIADPVGDVVQIEILDGRLVWIEFTDDARSEIVQIHDLQTGVTSTLTEIVLHDGGILDSTWVGDIGEAGVIIHRTHVAYVPWDSGSEFIELLGYDGQTRTIDPFPPQGSLGSVARFVGPYIVYQKNGAWVIYSPADDTRREIDPFAQISPGS